MNSFLVMAFIALVGISGISLYALTPVSYESVTGSPAPDVLGASDVNTNLNLENQLHPANLLPIDSEVTKFDVKNYFSNDSYIGKLTFQNEFESMQTENQIDILKIINSNNDSQEIYTTKFKINSEDLDKIKIYAVINNRPVAVTFDESGESEIPLTVAAGKTAIFGMKVSSVAYTDRETMVEIEVQRAIDF